MTEQTGKGALAPSVLPSLLWAALAGLWMPRGPLTTSQVLTRRCGLLALLPMVVGGVAELTSVRTNGHDLALMMRAPSADTCAGPQHVQQLGRRRSDGHGGGD
jgi:hypothetical protein